MSNFPPLPCIGILGGGQLGRMLALAAARLGLKVHVFDPSMDAPAHDVATSSEIAPYEDMAALERFADRVDVITYEFENIPSDALDFLRSKKPVRPDVHALEISQDRLREKAYLLENGLNVAPYHPVSSLQELEQAAAELGLPAILKTCRFGYDGKGQVRIASKEEIPDAFEALASAGPLVLEAHIPFIREISVIAARGVDGHVEAFDPGENIHRDGILRETHIPASISVAVRTDAVLMAGKLLNALEYVGVIGVEFFQTSSGLLINEFAPRVHNSGHWTQNGCAVDQFEQHIRAVAGWPLGKVDRHSDVTMINLIGSDMERIGEDMSRKGAALHLYGKTEMREGRKMGHVNFVRPLGEGS